MTKPQAHTQDTKRRAVFTEDQEIRLADILDPDAEDSDTYCAALRELKQVVTRYAHVEAQLLEWARLDKARRAHAKARRDVAKIDARIAHEVYAHADALAYALHLFAPEIREAYDRGDLCLPAPDNPTRFVRTLGDLEKPASTFLDGLRADLRTLARAARAWHRTETIRATGKRGRPPKMDKIIPGAVGWALCKVGVCVSLGSRGNWARVTKIVYKALDRTPPKDLKHELERAAGTLDGKFPGMVRVSKKKTAKPASGKKTAKPAE